jgi:hypothetical protein
MLDPYDKIRHDVASCEEVAERIGAWDSSCRCWTEWTDNQIRASLEMAVSV